MSGDISLPLFCTTTSYADSFLSMSRMMVNFMRHMSKRRSGKVHDGKLQKAANGNGEENFKNTPNASYNSVILYRNE